MHIDLTNGGTVIVYNKSFEKTRLKELSFIFKDKKDQLDKINDHIFDLLEVLRGSKELFPNTWFFFNQKSIASFYQFNIYKFRCEKWY